MLNLTLDHNCLIHLENKTGEWRAIKELIALHDASVVHVHVGLVSASENAHGGGEPTNAAFVDWSESKLRLSHLPQVPPEFGLGMSYLDYCVLGGNDDLAERVRAVVHPSLVGYDQFTSDRGLDPHGPIDRTWRNRICDIEAMVAHIRLGHDVFVTENTRDFIRGDGAVKLIALGAGRVLTPEQALDYVRATR